MLLIQITRKLRLGLCMRLRPAFPDWHLSLEPWHYATPKGPYEPGETHCVVITRSSLYVSLKRKM